MKKRPLLIIATARCVWDDVKVILAMFNDCGITKYHTMSVNQMVLFWKEELNYAVSLHPSVLVHLRDARMVLHGVHKIAPITYGRSNYKGLDHWGMYSEDDTNSSGMYAVNVGLHLDYDKIILAGLPFDDTGHFYDPPLTSNTRTRYCYNWPAKTAWDKVRDKSNDKVKAVSGSLIECFGELTDEWLKKE